MKRALLLGGLALSLLPMVGGCSVFRQIGLAPHYKPKQHLVMRDVGMSRPVPPAGASDISDKVRFERTALTMIARNQMKSGNYGLAIETFNLALESGEARAPALNGLGVAYAHLGRGDLAASYFHRAIEVDPVEERYQSNLAQLLASHGMAQTARRGSEAARGAISTPAMPQTAGVGQLSTRLVRTSSREVMVTTVAPGSVAGPVAKVAFANSPIVRAGTAANKGSTPTQAQDKRVRP